MLSDLEGNPPLYVTRKRSSGKQEDIYINNALILKSRSNVQLSNENGKKQVMIKVLLLAAARGYPSLVVLVVGANTNQLLLILPNYSLL